ncbi:hypothetical protein [Bacillus nitratireducens]|uniref:hypothetical protein n=1 Tax=Bacillus nitratireducens TaxID=2026193 RepID=UPI002E1D313C|nr:hypothetical protein [Bacillus nitratireducens]
MPRIYLRIFVARSADIQNHRIQYDLYTIRKILSPIEVRLITFQYLPRNLNYNFNQISCDTSQPVETELANHNPDGYAHDGRLITIYYLGGKANEACYASEFNNPDNNYNENFPINSYVYLANFPLDPFLFCHEVVHCLFDRLEDGVLINTDPDPLVGDPSHNANDDNLMYPITPDPAPYLSSPRDPLPERFFTIEQKRKAMGSQYVFNKIDI